LRAGAAFGLGTRIVSTDELAVEIEAGLAPKKTKSPLVRMAIE